MWYKRKVAYTIVHNVISALQIHTLRAPLVPFVGHLNSHIRMPCRSKYRWHLSIHTCIYKLYKQNLRSEDLGLRPDFITHVPDFLIIQHKEQIIVFNIYLLIYSMQFITYSTQYSMYTNIHSISIIFSLIQYSVVVVKVTRYFHFPKHQFLELYLTSWQHLSQLTTFLPFTFTFFSLLPPPPRISHLSGLPSTYLLLLSFFFFPVPSSST